MLQKTKVMAVESMMEAQRQFQELMQMDVQRATLTTTSRDPKMVKENARLKTEIATLRKQLQDKESAQGQTKGSTFSPRREMTQVQGQRKEQTEQLVEGEERSSFQHLPIHHDIEEPQEEAHAKIEPKRQEFQEQQDLHTKKMLRNLEEQEKNTTDKVLRESLQWEIKIIKQAIK